MSGQWIFIQPHDVWMFRDSKPFSAQQNFVARSLFPPTPQTIQGVIRTHYLESQSVNWKSYAAGNERPELYETVGHSGRGNEPPTLGNLRITGPLIATQNGTQTEILVQAPLDLVYQSETYQFATLEPSVSAEFQTNPPFKGWYPLEQPGGFKPADGWLSQKQFSDYLNKELLQGELRKTDTVFEYEDRIGLGMDHGRRSNEQGLLYRARFIRPHDGVGLMVYVNMPLFAESGFIRIGGESRSAKFHIVQDFVPPTTPNTNRIKIVLLTPAYFSDGWQPHNANWSQWVSGGSLVSAVVGKPQPISGWDVANNRSQALRHFVPAGSVYYFEGGELTGQSFTETPSGMADFAAMGYGSFAVGMW